MEFDFSQHFIQTLLASFTLAIQCYSVSHIPSPSVKIVKQTRRSLWNSRKWCSNTLVTTSNSTLYLIANGYNPDEVLDILGSTLSIQ